MRRHGRARRFGGGLKELTDLRRSPRQTWSVDANYFGHLGSLCDVTRRVPTFYRRHRPHLSGPARSRFVAVRGRRPPGSALPAGGPAGPASPEVRKLAGPRWTPYALARWAFRRRLGAAGRRTCRPGQPRGPETGGGPRWDALRARALAFCLPGARRGGAAGGRRLGRVGSRGWWGPRRTGSVEEHRDRRLVYLGEQAHRGQQRDLVADLPGDRPGVEVDPADGGVAVLVASRSGARPRSGGNGSTRATARRGCRGRADLRWAGDVARQGGDVAAGGGEGLQQPWAAWQL